MKGLVQEWEFQDFSISSPSFQTFLNYSETSEISKTKFLWLSLKFIRQHLYKKLFEKFRISNPLRGQSSAAGIFKILKVLNISLTIYHWKVFSSLISKEAIRNSKRFLKWGELAWIGGPAHLGEMIFISRSYGIFYFISIKKFVTLLVKDCFDHVVFNRF